MSAVNRALPTLKGFQHATIQDSRVLAGGIFLLALVPLFFTPVLPFIDFYNHIARYFVLANIDHDALLQQNYRANWSILPNVGLDIIVTGLMKLLPEPAVPRTTIILIFAVQYSGILYFNRALTGRISVLTALLTVPLLYSFILNWGFANFLLGLGLTFWAAGWWLSQRHRLVVALPVACIFAAVMFFVHGLTFALYGILVGMLEIGMWLRAPQRKWSALAVTMVPLATQAIVPVLLFLAAKTSQSDDGLTNADEAVARLSHTGQLSARLWALLQHRLISIVRVAEGPSLAFDVVAMAVVAMLLVLLIGRRRVSVAPVAIPALLVFALLVVVMPPAMFGVGYVADRMPLVLAMLFTGSLDVRHRADRLETWIFAALAGLAVLRLGGIAMAWGTYGEDKRDFDAIAAALPRGVLVENIVVGGDRLDYSRRRCTMFGPLLIAENGMVGRLFANETQQPLVMTGPLLAAINSQTRPPRGSQLTRGYFDTVVTATAHSAFPWLLICDADRLTSPVPATLHQVAHKGRFTLYSLR